MSKLSNLITQYCPEGVEYKTLGECGKFYGGLTGKSKKDFEDGNSKFITYKNVYSNPALCLDVEDKVRIEPGERQRTLEYGDIVFTGSSETPDECGISSVVAEIPEENLYLNSFCFIFRFDDPSILLPDFAKHLFRSSELRYQIGKTASGVTRYNVSKKLMGKVSFPVPPLEVQREIVRVLDSFTLLTAELTAELTARKQQYEFYRDYLLNGNSDYDICNLGDVCDVVAGGTPSRKVSDYWEDGCIPWLGSTVCKNKKNVDEPTEFITELGLEKSSAKMMKKDTTLIALVAFTTFDVAINQNIAGVYPKDTSKINPSYIYYACTTLYPHFLNLTQGSKLAMANLTFVRGLKISVPPIDVQNHLVNVLDNFESITSDLSIGLPAEIEARKKQYEYYRDALLTYASTGKIIARQTEHN